MFSVREFWRRHRRKVFISLGVVGSGYLVYKLYEAQKRLSDLEKELAKEHERSEVIKAQMEAHFENVQRIADTTTFPHAIHCLKSRIAEELDLSYLFERLVKAKDQSSSLTSSEKLELWDTLKILSFTRMLSSVWALTMLSLYIRVQVNILGRHLYIDTARGLGNSDVQDDGGVTHGYQQFLASAEFLPNTGLSALINDMQAAASDILTGKQLKDLFSTSLLRETILQILDTFMGTRKPYRWVEILMPADTTSGDLGTPIIKDDKIVANVTEFDQLMAETRAVLSSEEFGSVVEMSLKAVVDQLMNEIGLQIELPLARLMPRVAQMSSLLLEEPSTDRFIQAIREIPDVELFFTLVYSNAPSP